jgi:hypothetical protein
MQNLETDVFARHGIKHLSNSSLRLFRDAPAVWCGKYLLKAPDEVGPGAWRGHAVETGLDFLLYGEEPAAAIAAMKAEWDRQAMGLADDKTLEEAAALEDFLVQAAVAFGGLPIPLMRQARVELTLPNISVPLIGYADFVWPDHGRDLKTTWRLPSKADPSHIEQVATYARYFERTFHLVYVSPKRWTSYEVTQGMAAEAWDRVIETAHALRSMLERVRDGVDALSMFAPNYDDYHFSPPMTEAVKAAKAVRVLR